MSLIFSLSMALSLILLACLPAYIHFYFLGYFFNQKRYTAYILSVIAIIVSFAFLFYYFFSHFFSVKNNVIQWATEIIFVLITTTSIKFVKQGFQQKLLVHKIKAQQLHTELNLLKSQINPHFLFNTLNNLYSMALHHGDQKMADSIFRLSQLMRYSIYESSADYISLEKEVQQLHHYIDLQKLHFTNEDDINITLALEGDWETIKIPPMLLIPFVENAFKHGVSIKHPSEISIYLNVEDLQLHFNVENTLFEKEQNEDSQQSGLGLTQVKRRLELLYPEAHELYIKKDATKFVTRLIIKV